ncbi:Uncharacterised protein [Escherichia coli]|nr:Uncharacterised protein [Escherichia coli]
MHTFIFLVLIKNINGGGSWNITPMPNTDVCVQVLRTIESHGEPPRVSWRVFYL